MPDESHDSSRARMTVAEAARALGISQSAVRKRVKRGMIEHERTPNGRLIVYLNSAATSAASHDRVLEESHDAKTERYVRSLEDQVEYLRGQLEEERESRRRADTILAQLSRANEEQARTIRALEAPAAEPSPQEPTGAPEPDADATHRGDVPGAQGEPQESPLPWWGGWEIGLLGVLAAVFIVSALLALLVAVLPP